MNHLQALAFDDEARKRVRTITYNALEYYFTIDPLNTGQFGIDMNRLEPLPESEMNINPSGRAYHRVGNPIMTLGDGVKCFVGLIAALYSGRYRVILVDEPEAFLHPPLARVLGRELVAAAKVTRASLVVATHSSDFLTGCIESSPRVHVVRVTYKNDVATTRRLRPSIIKSLLSDPFLRSTNVLSAMFHKAAIVSEADTDRVFYSEVNRLLQSRIRGGGIEEALFLNANGKATISQLVGPLRRVGIPTVAVVDLDVLEQNSKPVWEKLLAACQVPKKVRYKVEMERRTVAHAFAKLDEASRKTASVVIRSDAYNNLIGEEKRIVDCLLNRIEEITPIVRPKVRAIKKQGIAVLTGGERTSALWLLAKLAEYGLFLVPTGEVECWLPYLNVRGHGPEWLAGMLKRIGSIDTATLDPSLDVWGFVENMARWIDDPNRRGTRFA